VLEIVDLLTAKLTKKHPGYRVLALRADAATVLAAWLAGERPSPTEGIRRVWYTPSAVPRRAAYSYGHSNDIKTAASLDAQPLGGQEAARTSVAGSVLAPLTTTTTRSPGCGT
jgi:hypothetical protein